MIFFVLAAVLVYLANPYVSGFLKEHTPVYEFIDERCQEVFTLENLKNQVGNQEEETEGSTEADTSSLTRVEGDRRPVAASGFERSAGGE